MQLKLACTGCTTSLEYGSLESRCPQCGEPLEVRGYEQPAIRAGEWPGTTLLERYAEFLPSTGYDPRYSLGEGSTPLLDAPALAAELGIARLLLKNETMNPTWSFKDRGTVVGLVEALRLGCRALGVVSTGNMAASVAAYGARADLPVLVLVGADTPVEKLAGIAAYAPSIVRVHGNYADLYDRSLKLASGRLRFLNSDSPARVEGSKTIAYEICEQMRFEPPSCVIVPTSSGGNLRGVMKGFDEMRKVGLIRALPRFVCVQAKGCAPICDAWERDADVIRSVSRPNTIAHAIANPRPPSGNAVLRRLRAMDGWCVAVDDVAMVQAQRRLAATGVLGQPEAAASVAAAALLAKRGWCRSDETVVCVVTGSGLKYPQSVEMPTGTVAACSLDEIDAHVGEWLERTSGRR
jgi:threonine synthase